MPLRRQLLLLGLLFLLLPVAGFLFIREVEQLLRVGQEQALLASSQALADRIRSEPSLLEQLQNSSVAGAGEGLYALQRELPIALDGYEDDWLSLYLQAQRYSMPGLAWSLRLLRSGDSFYGFITVYDNRFQFHEPSIAFPASGDFLALALGQGQQRRVMVLRTSAPGEMQVVAWQGQQQRPEHRVRAVWREQENGYQVEFELPLTWVGSGLTLGVYDADNQLWLSNVSGQSLLAEAAVGQLANSAIRPVITVMPPLQAIADQFVHPNSHISLLSSERWLLADSNQLSASGEQAPAMAWLVRWLLNDRPLTKVDMSEYLIRWSEPEIRTALSEGISTTSWYQFDQSSNLLRVVVPILSADELASGEPGSPPRVAGLVVVEQGTRQWLGLADHAFRRLLFYSGLVLAFFAVVLFSYATWLSVRIRRLSRAAASAVNSDGSINLAFPRSAMRDEIGDLNRHYRELLLRVAEYHDYLRTLASKLSHELRTPLAIVKSSLDNLATGELPEAQVNYLQRAQSGADRLSKILTAMNSAQRIEETITQTELEPVNLWELVAELVAAYQALTEQQLFTVSVQLPANPVWVMASPELIVQMLDKLFDNAVDFCDAEGEITIQLLGGEKNCQFSVSNSGPLLPATMADQLFSSMVSVRAQKGDEPHLGLGLHIVKLVADFHGGQVTAGNRDDGKGVTFTVRMPVISPQD
ncbi:ATP-binding protein [Halioxenophilus sp. WMMB6]|uniref:ATP-binding protein n=1 Tax=Halioxenophilus sp. WMMB6 TaxID=3073815 RepID=UPI00295F43E2|nr:ATP-binding protein [Halioxenophilus sp. WMMB6]